MEKMLKTAVFDQSNSNPYFDTVLFDKLTAFITALASYIGEPAVNQVMMANQETGHWRKLNFSRDIGAVREPPLLERNIKNVRVQQEIYIRYMLTAVHNRIQRQNLPVEVLKYYRYFR